VSLCPLSAFPFFGFQKLIIQIQKEDPTGGGSKGWETRRSTTGTPLTQRFYFPRG